MIKIIPTTLSGTTPYAYSIEIEEVINGGFFADNLPSVDVTVKNSGDPIVSGSNIVQKLIFSITAVYQTNSNESGETKTKTFAEVATISVPGTGVNVTPTIGNASVVATKYMCCGRKAKGLKIRTSVSAAFA